MLLFLLLALGFYLCMSTCIYMYPSIYLFVLPMVDSMQHARQEAELLRRQLDERDRTGREVAQHMMHAMSSHHEACTRALQRLTGDQPYVCCICVAALLRV